MATNKPTVFVSHASADRELAIKLKVLLEKAVDANVFCASEVGAIGGGNKWFIEIMTQLKLARACVALLTPKSVYFSPWVAFEAGAAQLRNEAAPSESRLWPVCAYGFTVRNVPAPFSCLQVLNLSNEAELNTLVGEISGFLGVKARKATRPASAVRVEAAKGSPDWGHVLPTLVGQRQGSSPFNLGALLKFAKASVFCAGFNLKYVATDLRIRNELLAWLKEEPARSVRLLISNCPTAQALADCGLVDKDYLADHHKSLSCFRSWKAEGKKRRLKKGQLDIRVAPYCALTVLAIDADSNNGQIVLTPTIWERKLSPERPHFWLSRIGQLGVFSYYWDTYSDLFKNAMRL